MRRFTLLYADRKSSALMMVAFYGAAVWSYHKLDEQQYWRNYTRDTPE